VKQRHSRFVGTQLGQIQQRVESKTGRITRMPSLHHHHHHQQQQQQQQQWLPITVPQAYLRVDTRRTGAKPGQQPAGNSCSVICLTCAEKFCTITKLTEM